jgi:hypothetical protein
MPGAAIGIRKADQAFFYPVIETSHSRLIDQAKKPSP